MKFEKTPQNFLKQNFGNLFQCFFAYSHIHYVTEKGLLQLI